MIYQDLFAVYLRTRCWDNEQLEYTEWNYELDSIQLSLVEVLEYLDKKQETCVNNNSIQQEYGYFIYKKDNQ
jgi:hypothetical protein